ncbi:MAG: phosphatidate cytidylyltransferase [Verrucomicrobiota bacterium]
MSETPAAEPPPKTSKARTLLHRSFSTVCLVGILVAAFSFSQEWLFGLLFTILSIGALFEYFQLFAIQGFRRFRWQCYVVSAVYIIFLFAQVWGYEATWLAQLDGLALGILLILIIADRLRLELEGARTLDEVSAAIFGFVYCVMLFGFVPKLLLLDLADRNGNPSAVFYIIYLLAITKCTDIGAYLVGSLLGRHKMIPHVSPAKSWQGFAGAIGFAVGISLILVFVMGDRIPLITPLQAILIAVLLSLAAVLGDLCESIIKRSLAVKDSGQLMPGIGGFLDLIDSIIFTAPLFYLYLMLLR